MKFAFDCEAQALRRPKLIGQVQPSIAASKLLQVAGFTRPRELCGAARRNVGTSPPPGSETRLFPLPDVKRKVRRHAIGGLLRLAVIGVGALLPSSDRGRL